MYANYRTNWKIYAFFVPHAGSPQTSYRLSEALVDASMLADLKIADDTPEASDRADSGLLAVNNMKFSQVIYIYHEDLFSADQSAQLAAHFSVRGSALFCATIVMRTTNQRSGTTCNRTPFKFNPANRLCIPHSMPRMALA